MGPFSFSIRIQASTEKTFEFFTDLRHAADRIEGIKRLELLTDGPIGKGTRFRETRVMFNREATEEMEITGFEQNKSYTVGAISCGVEWSSTFRFTPDAGGTRVDMDMVCRPVSLFAKLMSPLMAGSMKKCIEKDMVDLKNAVEKA